MRHGANIIFQFLDSDDLLLPGKFFPAQVATLETAPALSVASATDQLLKRITASNHPGTGDCPMRATGDTQSITSSPGC